MATVARCSVILADVIVIAVTLARLSGQVKEALDLNLATTISTAMLVDGKNIGSLSEGLTD